MKLKSLFVFSVLFWFFSSNAQTKKTIYIADRTVLCENDYCFQIKEKKKNAWQTISDTIADLNYKEGFEYRIKVSVSGSKYSLVKIISKKTTGYNPAAKLENKKWILQSMFDGNSTLRLQDSTVYLQLNVAENRFSGHGVCNRLMGNLTAAGNSISFGNIASTKMKCIAQGNVFEKIIQNLLEATDSYSLKYKSLTLISSKGSRMVFEEQ